MSDDILWEGQKSIEYIINEVADRGWSDKSVEIDDFAKLRMDRRFREAQVAGLYEQYFLPERHEFEWQVLSEIITSIVSSSSMEFTAAAMAGGVIGNSAFELLKKMFSYAASLFEKKLGKEAHERAMGFKKLSDDSEKIQAFFTNNHKARVKDIEQETGIPRERLYPLLKLAGLKHYRRSKNSCYWEIQCK